MILGYDFDLSIFRREETYEEFIKREIIPAVRRVLEAEVEREFNQVSERISRGIENIVRNLEGALRREFAASRKRGERGGLNLNAWPEPQQSQPPARATTLDLQPTATAPTLTQPQIASLPQNNQMPPPRYTPNRMRSLLEPSFDPPSFQSTQSPQHTPTRLHNWGFGGETGITPPWDLAFGDQPQYGTGFQSGQPHIDTSSFQPCLTMGYEREGPFLVDIFGTPLRSPEDTSKPGYRGATYAGHDMDTTCFTGNMDGQGGASGSSLAAGTAEGSTSAYNNPFNDPTSIDSVQALLDTSSQNTGLWVPPALDTGDMERPTSPSVCFWGGSSSKNKGKAKEQ